MLYIGSHVSFSKDKQLLGSALEAISYGSNTFMFYTGAPQNTLRMPIDDNLTINAIELMKENNIDISKVIVHAPYIINLANPNNFDFSVSFLKQEIKRCEELGIKYLVLHPGSHVGNGINVGLNTICEALNLALDKDTNVSICLETMAGKGSELGCNFEQLKYIIDNVKYNDKIMVCLDTCHLNDSGYDVSNFDNILDEFDKIVGIEKIGCVHINDSKNPIGSHKDRHENLGFGTIGFNTLISIIYNNRLDNIPKILETPWIKDDKDTYPPYKFEIEMIRNKEFNNDVISEIKRYYS
ncbi:MAG: deoxyribonuclease IV [Bacilli bacterium]|nr:deoxyribonuclease IV [Bacilli bacterium]